MPRHPPPKLPPPRPELASLLAAVKEAPDDEAPLFVLADWLEEQSSEDDRTHGELIRLEARLQRAEREDWRTRAAAATCSLEPGPIISSDAAALARKALRAERPELEEMDQRATELANRHSGSRARLLGPGREVYWPRGLIRLDCLPRSFKTGFMNAVAESELGCWLHELNLRHCKAKDVKRIAGCSLLAHLADLSVDHQKIEAAGAAALAASPHLGRLVSLDVSCARIGDEGVAALAGAALGGLRDLHLTHTQFTLAGATALNGAAWFGGLRTLNLCANYFDADCVAALFEGQTMPRLQWLNLGSNNLGAEGVDALLAPGRFPTLRGLSLNHNAIGRKGLSRLRAWPGLSGLVNLSLDGCDLGDHEAEALAGCAALANLTSLSLGPNQIGDKGLLALARSPHLRGLFGLDLNSNQIGPAGGEALADARHFPRLVWLNGWGNAYGESATLGVRQRFPYHGSS
jgi:uncharacterized protein (TIGR02996 family)